MILHEKYYNATDDEIVAEFLSGKYIKRLQQIYGVISVDKHISIITTIKYLLTIPDIPKMWYEDFYCLLTYASPDEINDCLTNKWKIIKWGNSLSNYIAKYGTIHGTMKYNDIKNISSMRNKGNSLYQSVEYKAKKHNITVEEAKTKDKTIRENAYKLRINRYGEEHKQTSSRLSKAYYYKQGITDEYVIEKLRKPYLEAVGHSLKSYIIRYGEQEGPIKFELLKQKRKDTILRKAANNEMPEKRKLKGAASKESSKFFKELLILLGHYGHMFDKQDIHLGIAGYKSEWWITNKEDKKVYYFIDFYIPKYKIAVEFDGVFFHCIDVNNWPNKSTLLKESNQYYYDKDEKKKQAITEQTNLFITVRSDSYVINDIAKQISNYIKLMDGKNNE